MRTQYRIEFHYSSRCGWVRSLQIQSHGLKNGQNEPNIDQVHYFRVGPNLRPLLMLLCYVATSRTNESMTQRDVLLFQYHFHRKHDQPQSQNYKFTAGTENINYFGVWVVIWVFEEFSFQFGYFLLWSNMFVILFL